MRLHLSFQLSATWKYFQRFSLSPSVKLVNSFAVGDASFCVRYLPPR
ncbi:hypothetical protein FGIG_04358 [Fasciola gigantica]|uniref:Uncharacterized protein n=1 Tax=Fasciola gigantica TaxID=46835 RepID=A0A504YQ97_FASGI|nr:hypothetical protein FGIG_04358 [Fasciola gigantica]